MKTKGFFKYLCFSLVAVLMTACKDDEMKLSASYVEFKDSEVTVSYFGGEQRVFVNWSETDWKLEYEEGGFITGIDPMTGGNKTDIEQSTPISVSFAQNDAEESRSQKITVHNLTTGETATMTFTQRKVEAAMAFEQSTRTVPYTAGTTIINVLSSDTEWEISSEADWVEFDPAEGGNVAESDVKTPVNITFTKNDTDSPRNAVIKLTNKNSETTAPVEMTLIQNSANATGLTAAFDANTKYQEVEGFGGMLNPDIWVGDGEELTEDDMKKIFGTGDGQLGFNIVRLMAYDTETEWRTDLNRIKAAQSVNNDLIVFASPWYPPMAYCTEHTTESGEKYRQLNDENWGDYANHLARYVQFMDNNGVDLYALSVQNEPDMHFTLWDYDQNGHTRIRDFVKQYGQTIKNAGVKLMAPEACGSQIDFNDAIKNDGTAWGITDIMVGHLYQGFIPNDEYSSSWTEQNAEKLRNYFNGWSLKNGGKPWWMTEHLFNQGADSNNSSDWVFKNWDYNLTHLGKEVHYCMTHDCSAYVYWYLKRYYGIMGDSDTQRTPVPQGDITKNGYILSHYAKYAKQSQRIKLTVGDSEDGSDTSEEIYGTAYEQDGDKTFIFQNYNSDKDYVITLSGFESTLAAEKVEGVFTDETNNMQPLTPEIEGQTLKIPVPKLSIVSVRVKP